MVITHTQCFVYSVQNLYTPIIFHFMGGVRLLTLAGTNGIILGLCVNIRVSILFIEKMTVIVFMVSFSIYTHIINPMHSEGHFLTLDCLHGMRVCINWRRVGVNIVQDNEVVY